MTKAHSASSSTLIAWRPPPDPLLPPTSGLLHLWWIDTGGGHQTFTSLFSDDERTRAARFIDNRARQRFLFARGAMRSILGHYLNHPPAALRFKYGPMGKPALDSPESNLHFNLSHSGNRALLAITTGSPVGIDLEPVRRVPNAPAMAQKVFSTQIARYLSELPEDRLSREFLHHWTLLEARLKAEGQGVFSRSCSPIPALAFQPAEGWSAAVALHPRVPDAEAWKCYHFLSGG